ncbi:MAG TPA: formylglycine-generating enzyme family protein [Nitrospiria bacterium]
MFKKILINRRLINLYGLVLFIVSLILPLYGMATTPPPGMVYVPPGSFIMGSTEKDGIIGVSVGVDEVPQFKVHLPGFFIDQYEVTTTKYKEFLDDTGREPPGDKHHPEVYPWKRDGGVPPELADHPVIYVSWFDADAYCRWEGKRLPTEQEWEKAARGTDGRIWPWGNTFDPAKANVREYWFQVYDREKDPGTVTKRDYSGTTPVGSFPEGVSPFGVYDMTGNVAEWTSSWYQAYPGSTLKRKAFGEVVRVFRGGSNVLEGNLYGRAAHRTTSTIPEKKHRSLGFRCAKDDE